MRPNPLVINAAELLRRPGTTKVISVATTPAELDVVDERLDPDARVDVDLRLESLSDGIVVAGTLRAPWHAPCRRCLAPIDATVDAQVDERFQLHVSDPDASPIVGDVIDLAPVMREVLLVELPPEPLCRPDCAGLCPTCGSDRNDAPCRCDGPPADDRWSVLDQLKGTVEGG